MRTTRAASYAQEKHIAKVMGGKPVSNSGATPFNKGDVTLDHILIEGKTLMKPQTGRRIEKSWFTKNKEEAFAMKKDFGVVAFDFGDGENFYAVNERTFKMLSNLYNESVAL